jgi:hypothetical protein
VDRLKLKAEVVWREVDGELVALDGEFQNYLGANTSGLLLWEALAHGASRDELVRRLAERFELEHDRAAHDVDAFVAQLREQDLLET